MSEVSPDLKLSSLQLTTTGDTTFEGQVLAKEGADIRYTATTGYGPTNVIIGKGGSSDQIADPFTESATELFPLGTSLVYGDRTFRYCFSDGAVTAGKLLQTAAAITHHRAMGTAVAAIAATAVTVTLGGTLVSLNQYKDGYLHVYDAAGEGQLLRIASHPAADASATCVITLYDPVTTALTTDSKTDLILNPSKDVILAPTTETGVLVGVTTIDTADNRYFWAQVSGPSSVLLKDALVLGNAAVRSGLQAGACAAATDNVLQEIGDVMVVNADGEYGVINLNIH